MQGVQVGCCCHHCFSHKVYGHAWGLAHHGATEPARPIQALSLRCQDSFEKAVRPGTIHGRLIMIFLIRRRYIQHTKPCFFPPKLSTPHNSQFIFIKQPWLPVWMQRCSTKSVPQRLSKPTAVWRAEQSTAVWRPDDESWKCENVKMWRDLVLGTFFPGKVTLLKWLKSTPRCFEDLTVGYQSYACFSYRLVDARRGSLLFSQDPQSKGCKRHQLFQQWHHWSWQVAVTSQTGETSRVWEKNRFTGYTRSYRYHINTRDFYASCVCCWMCRLLWALRGCEAVSKWRGLWTKVPPVPGMQTDQKVESLKQFSMEMQLSFVSLGEISWWAWRANHWRNWCKSVPASFTSWPCIEVQPSSFTCDTRIFL